MILSEQVFGLTKSGIATTVIDICRSVVGNYPKTVRLRSLEALKLLVVEHGDIGILVADKERVGVNSSVHFARVVGVHKTLRGGKMLNRSRSINAKRFEIIVKDFV